MLKLEELSPTSQLSFSEDIELITTVLNAESISKEQLKKIDALTDVEQLFQDASEEPRANLKDAKVVLQSLLDNKLKEHVVPYLNLIDPQVIETSLLKRDLEKATNWQWILHKFSIRSVPRVSTLNDIRETVPAMDKMTEMCLLLSGKAGIPTFPGMDANKKGMFQQLKDMVSQEKHEQVSLDFESSDNRVISQLTRSGNSRSTSLSIGENSESSVQMHDNGYEPDEDLDEPLTPKVTSSSPKIEGISSTIERGNKEIGVSNPALGVS